MIKSNRKLLIFEIITALIMILCTFLFPVLLDYKMVLFLLLVLIVFKYLFGFEKDKTGNSRNLILEIIVFLLTYFIIYFLFGLSIGFTRTGTIQINKVLYIISYYVEREILRFYTLKKSDTSILLTVSTVFFFIILDLCCNYEWIIDKTNYTVIWNLLVIVFPIISTNIVLSNLTKKSSYNPLIIYTCIMNTYSYLLPVVPNTTMMVTMMINTIVPILLWVRISSYYDKVNEKKYSRLYSEINLIILLAPLLVLGTMIYFSSGYFQYEAVVIATNTMQPELNKGDIVIVNKKIKQYDTIRIGDVIAYKKNNSVIIHRVMKKTQDKGTYTFYATSNKDDYDIVKEEELIGTTHIKIRYLGYPSIWLNNN